MRIGPFLRYLSMAVVLVFVTSMVVPATGPSTVTTDALNVSVFLFSILSGFTISILWERLSAVRDALGMETSHLLTIYALSRVFGKNVQKKLADAMDKYVILGLHFPLEMYEKSDKAFMELFKTVEDLKPRTSKQDLVYEEMIGEMEEMEDSRMVTIYTAKLRLLNYLRFSLIALGAIVVGLLFWTRVPTLESQVLSFSLSLVVVVIYVVIVELNKLQIWEDALFETNVNRFYDLIGKTVFYDLELIQEGRHVPKPGEKYRTHDKGGRIVTRVWPKKK